VTLTPERIPESIILSNLEGLFWRGVWKSRLGSRNSLLNPSSPEICGSDDFVREEGGDDPSNPSTACWQLLGREGRPHPLNSALPRVRTAHFLAHRSERRVNDNIRPGAVNDSLQLGLLFSRHLEFIQGLLKIVQERLPLLARNLQGAWEWDSRSISGLP